MELSKRHSKLLKIIIEDYAYTASPIASNDVIKKYMKNVSSATVRNDMAVLEKHGFLEKTHTSSGRIPSIEGYKYYEKNILHPTISDDVKNKLRKIFNNRELSIDTIIDQSVEILKETFKLPLMVTSNHNAEKLKRFDLIQIDKGQALIIIVTSGGEVIKNTINFNTDKQFDDIAICIRVFNDRLVDTPLTQLEEKIISLKEIIRKVVHEYEFCIRQIIEKIFNFKKISTKTNIVGTKYLTLQHEFHDINRLNQVLMFLEDTNVWKHISFLQEKQGKTNITFGDEIGQKGLAIASTTIKSCNNEKRQLSIIGPTRMDYSKVQGVLDFIREEMEKYDN